MAVSDVYDTKRSDYAKGRQSVGRGNLFLFQYQGVEPRVSRMLGKCTTTELHLQPKEPVRPFYNNPLTRTTADPWELH